MKKTERKLKENPAVSALSCNISLYRLSYLMEKSQEDSQRRATCAIRSITTGTLHSTTPEA